MFDSPMRGGEGMQFVDASIPWAHLDIAGTAWKFGGQGGATGFAAATLVEWVIGNSKS